MAGDETEFCQADRVGGAGKGIPVWREWERRHRGGMAGLGRAGSLTSLTVLLELVPEAVLKAGRAGEDNEGG